MAESAVVPACPVRSRLPTDGGVGGLPIEV
jgi:hypothetical protein